ncbi:MAG TPA: glycerophosphodiester phosphodiesterase family protein [Vicinamibacteria bacterium]|nr:glycerophosphodiester phosphodiesterase family protein [Vicinamibacteria bacterium]
MAPLIIAHRGDSAHRPENTLASFASALEQGADLVEFDIQLTKDGQVVVIHDATLDRTTSGRGKVSELTLAEIRSVSAGYPERFGNQFAGERVPVLAEVLGLLRGRAKAMIEIKSDSVTDAEDDGVEARMLAEVRRAGVEGEVAVLSFDRRALARCRTLAPELVRGHLFYRATPAEVVEGARQVESRLVMPEKGMLSEDLRDQAKRAGLLMATWVVDDPTELQSLARFDLYGVGSNRPGELLEALRDGDGLR